MLSILAIAFVPLSNTKVFLVWLSCLESLHVVYSKLYRYNTVNGALLGSTYSKEVEVVYSVPRFLIAPICEKMSERRKDFEPRSKKKWTGV